MFSAVKGCKNRQHHQLTICSDTLLRRNAGIFVFASESTEVRNEKQGASMDPLSHLLLIHNPQGSIDKNCVLSGEWQLPHRPGHLCSVRWHTVVGGPVMLDMPGTTGVRLSSGSVVFLPQNAAHRIYQLHAQPTQLVSGLLQLPASAHAFLTALPEVLTLAPAAESMEARWLAAALPLLTQSDVISAPGDEALRSHQISAMFTLALRNGLSETLQNKSLLTLALHPRIGTLIAQLCAAPEKAWTVTEMAQHVFMSRASFAQLFRQLSATTPLAVLTSIRLQLAAQQLVRDPAPVINIALAVGYASESSFHKAFVREFDCTPGEYRRRAEKLAKADPDRITGSEPAS